MRELSLDCLHGEQLRSDAIALDAVDALDEVLEVEQRCRHGVEQVFAGAALAVSVECMCGQRWP